MSGNGVSSKLRKFDLDSLHDRELVMKMLSWETTYTLSSEGQELFRLDENKTTTSVDVETQIIKKTLNNFDFSSDDQDVLFYRYIFGTYYKSSTEYDKEVISKSYYMINNRCMYYTTLVPKKGDKLIDVPMLTLQGNKIMLFDLVKDAKYVLFQPFSMT
jgi:hypothetical protein